jgi:hypothetical protein
MYLSAHFRSIEPAAAALRDLRANGLTPLDLDVFSREPVEFAPGVLDRPSHMSLAVVSGAITAFLLIVSFVAFTQYNYPLITGGMPLFSPWATGVVFYEITMLGAIVTTFSLFLWESGLLKRRRAPVPTIVPGFLCLRVHCQTDQIETVTRSLEQSGAESISQLGEAS